MLEGTRETKSGDVLVCVFIAVKRNHDHSNSYKENIELRELTYSFRGSVHYHHDGKHGRAQASLVLVTSQIAGQQEVS